MADESPAKVPIPVARQVPLRWVGLDDFPLMAATTFVGGVLAPGELILLIGQAVPPLPSGDPQQQAEFYRTLPEIEAKPLLRLVLSPSRVRELIKALEDTLALNDALMQATQDQVEK